jgi:hypothetical protein
MSKLQTLFPQRFSSSMIEDLNNCDLAWFNKHCRKLSMGEKSHHLIAGGLIASAMEISRKAFYNDGLCEKDAIHLGEEFILAAEDTGDMKKSNENLAFAFRMYWKSFPMATGWQPVELANGQNAIEYKLTYDTGIPHPEIKNQNILITGKLDFLGEKMRGNERIIAIVDDKTIGISGKYILSDPEAMETEKDEYRNRGQFVTYKFLLKALWNLDINAVVVRRMPLLVNFEPAYELEVELSAFQMNWWEKVTINKIKSLVEKYEEWKIFQNDVRDYFPPKFSSVCSKLSRDSKYKFTQDNLFGGKACEYLAGCLSKTGDSLLAMRGEQIISYPEVETPMPLAQYLKEREINV